MSFDALTRSAASLWRTYGALGVRHRTAFEIRRRIGAFRNAPSAVPALALETPPPSHWPFVVQAGAVARATDRQEGRERAERVARGEYQAYRCTWNPRPDTPGAWITHPITGHLYDPEAPWYRVAHLRREAGDIKDVWEPARFGWAYDLARGWMLTREDRFADAFWRSTESFLEGCAPFRGVHWSCGQETAIRATAWLWAESSLGDAPASTLERLRTLRRALLWSGERIADALGYAISQRNNHGLSEATGLVLLGARFLDVDPRARGWLDAGRHWLDALVRDQFAPDGWYIQHSFTYARMAVDQLVLAERALRAVGRHLSRDVVERVRLAVELLLSCIDDRGELPNHGGNDGAYVLPLTTRRYRDFRASLTAAAATFDVAVPRDIELDREPLAWLDLPEPPVATPRPLPRVSSGASGWADVRVGGARVFTRAAMYESRPGHIDPLHVDVWIEGRRVALDAGSYRYAGDPIWSNALADVDVHNTLTVVDRPPAVRGPRFLWLTWPHARLIDARIAADGSGRCELVNESWRDEGVLHRRVCEVYPQGVLVLDVFTCPFTFTDPIRVHWLLERSLDDIAVVSTGAIHMDTRTGDPRSHRGWVSECYGVKRPATSVLITARPERGYFALATGFGDRRSPDQLATALRRRATPPPR